MDLLTSLDDRSVRSFSRGNPALSRLTGKIITYREVTRVRIQDGDEFAADDLMRND